MLGAWSVSLPKCLETLEAKPVAVTYSVSIHLKVRSFGLFFSSSAPDLSLRLGNMVNIGAVLFLFDPQALVL